jgi:glycosyltransferase involved in cell wall biosynthesis
VQFSRKKKIMHVIVGLETGGAETMLHRLVNAMHEHTHIVVSLTAVGPLGQELMTSGHAVHALGMRLPTAWKAIARLWQLIRGHRPDVIQTWMYHADLVGGVVGRLAGVRNIVWNVRNTEIPQSRLSATGVVIRLCAALSRWVPRAIACCAHAGLDSHAALGYSRERMVVIPNGYDIHAWQIPTKSRCEIRSSYGLPCEAFIVGIVGRFDPLKGHDTFVDAAGRMVKRSDNKLLFVMVGRHVDEDNEKLRQLIADTGGNARFKLLGERRDIAQIMFSLDVYCLSSKAEGFPNVVAEAMLMQVPCVVTDVGDASRIVGSTGKVVPPGQPAALADALLAFEGLADQERQDMGRAARQRIVDNYDIEVIAQRYANLYEYRKDQ